VGTDGKRWGLARVMAAAVAVGAVLLASALYTVLCAPIGPGSEVVAVSVVPGSDLSTIGSNLQESGVLSHRRSFLWAARLAGLERKLRSGDYEISPSWTLPTLLETLSSGKGRMLSVTLPEGISTEEVAGRLEAAGITDGEAFLALTRDRDFLDYHEIPGPTAEGFLFPETYLFAPSSRPEDVATAMFNQFREVFRELETERTPGDINLLEVVTLASLVERETGLPEERPLVAAVFHNRLRLNYRLQTDPSVIYGIEDFDGNLTREDLKTYSPYNTYVIPGLPPGPIANPGRGALRAVLQPAQVDYLYFVSRNDGSHHFSRSLSEHNQAVRQYQLARRRK